MSFLEALPSTVLRLVLDTPFLIWDTVFQPVPGIMAIEMRRSVLFPTLALLVAMCAASVALSNFWFFSVSALMLVWIETQYAYSIGTMFKGKKKHIPVEGKKVPISEKTVVIVEKENEAFECPPIAEEAEPREVRPEIEEALEPKVEAFPSPTQDAPGGEDFEDFEEADVAKYEFLKPKFDQNAVLKQLESILQPQAGSERLWVFPASVMDRFSPEVQAFLQNDIGRSLMSSRTRGMPSDVVEEGTSAVREDEIKYDEEYGPSQTSTLAMEAVQQELAALLGTIRSPKKTDKLGADLDQGVRIHDVPDDEVKIPERPHAPLSPEVVDSQAEDIPSMESFDTDSERSSKASSAHSSARNSVDLTASQNHASTTDAPAFQKERKFRIIDDVLCEYEASLHSIKTPGVDGVLHDKFIEDADHEGLTSGDESQIEGDFSDFSRPESPITSASCLDEDELRRESIKEGKKPEVPTQLYQNDMGSPWEDQEDDDAKGGVPTTFEYSFLEDYMKNRATVPKNTDTITEPSRSSVIDCTVEQVTAGTGSDTGSSATKDSKTRPEASRANSSKRKRKGKNNGWKNVPRKKKLAGNKRRFVSRAFW